MATLTNSPFIDAIIGGVVASLMFFLAMLFIRPRVKISGKICRVGKVFRIKVVNCTWWMLKNPRYTLEAHEPRPGKNFANNPIKPLQPAPLYIDKYRPYNPTNSYAVRFSYGMPEEYLTDERCDFEFVFIAEHAFSNTTICKKRRYTCDDIIEGKFVSGKSMDIIPKKTPCKEAKTSPMLNDKKSRFKKIRNRVFLIIRFLLSV